MEGKPLPGGFLAGNVFPIYMNEGMEGKPLPGGFLAGNAFPLHMKTRCGTEASSRWLVGRECLPAICEDEVWKGSLCQVACWPGMPSRYRCGREASARWLVGRECLPAIYEEGMEGKPLPGCFLAGNAFPLFLKTKLLPGGLSAENAFPLYMEKAWKGSLCQAACPPRSPSCYI